MSLLSYEESHDMGEVAHAMSHLSRLLIATTKGEAREPATADRV